MEFSLAIILYLVTYTCQKSYDTDSFIIRNFFPFSSFQISLTFVSTEKDLGEVLSATSKVSVDWFGFGIALGIQYKDLKDIEGNYPRNVQRCRIEMLRSWISLGHATWTKLVETLRSQNEVSVAEDIEKNRFLI